MSITPIETRYAGCRFRSRLEARWAVFFDAVGVKWQYELQGFAVGCDKIPYLPDFYLPEARTWVEVKGAEDALNKPLLEAFAAERHLMILGPIPIPHEFGEWCWTLLSPEPITEPERDELGNYDYTACEFGAQEHLVSFNAWRDKGRLWEHWPRLSPAPAWTSPVLDEDYIAGTPTAYASARSARFEYGERG